MELIDIFMMVYDYQKSEDMLHLWSVSVHHLRTHPNSSRTLGIFRNFTKSAVQSSGNLEIPG